MNIKKNYIFLINIAFLLLIIAGDVCYIVLGGLLIKGLTSSLFVLLGLINLLFTFKTTETNIKFSIFMLLGLFFAMLGDIVLNIFFIGGAILFAVGHVFYFVSYCFIESFKKNDLMYGIIIFVPSVLFITLAPIFEFNSSLMEIVCVVYAIIISCMVGKALSNLITNKILTNGILFLGSFLFFFSDLMLLLNKFAKLPRVVDILCLATYYPAQFLLAFSVLLINLGNLNNKVEPKIENSNKM